jgi:peptide subunit release factor 1 (eRF1)
LLHNSLSAEKFISGPAGCDTGVPGADEPDGIAMSKQAMREETERLIREAMEKKAISVKQGQTRIETKCWKCGAPNRVSAAPGQTRVEFHCKECGQKQKTL